MPDLPPSPLDAEVSLLEWPADEALRQQLSALGLPRILLVAADQEPPAVLDAREDWMRAPVDPVELHARVQALLLRGTVGPPGPTPIPVLDDDGLLRVGSSWVAVTDAQLPVVRLLVDNLDRVVRFDAITATYEAAGGSSHPASVRTLLGRVAARVSTVGLELVSVRRRGVLLAVCASLPGILPG